MEPSRASLNLVRRGASSLAFAVIAAQFAALDVAFRGGRATLAQPTGLADVVTSTALLLGFALLATTRARRALLASAAAAVLVVQVLVFRYFHTPLDVQVAASALHYTHEVKLVLGRAAPGLCAAIAVVAAAEYALLSFAHASLGPRTGAAVPGAGASRATSSVRGVLGVTLGVASLGGLFGASPRRATPEIRAAHALRALGERRAPPAASAVALPPLHVERAELPSVLFVLTESVRAADYRAAGEAPTAPETAALTRGRTDLAQLRAVSSYTALSLSAILTGRSQEGARDAILRAPSLFDFAHAARDARGGRPTVAYYSSQAATVFESSAVRAAVDRFATVETVRGHDVEDDADYGELPLDRDAVALFLNALPELPVASVVMLHLVGTHAPYFLDAERAPFQPYDHVVTWSGMPKLLNAYRDAIFEQDRTLARAVGAFIAHAGEHPWLVVFTSDHGEAFGEHGAIHHGQNLMDEQIHVPGWIVGGGGALTEAQERALAAHAGRFVTHLDLLPTVLDAMGLWDNFAVKEHRAAMAGQSLLRPPAPRAPVPVTNCTGMFQCPTNTWGLLDEDRKLVSAVWDGGWWCYALGGPEERPLDVSEPGCARLRALSQRPFPLLPNGAPNR